MKFKNHKLPFLIAIIVFITISCISVFAFDWPQNSNSTDSFFSYFGQLRGNTLSSSLIFNQNEEIHASDDGNMMIFISEHTNDFGWFESTLGNAIIMSHDDNLATVYANLDEEEIPQSIETLSAIEKGTFLGVSGNSGWQDGSSCLEFQVIDRIKHSSINPRILMPRIGEELPLDIGRITLDDANGTTHHLSNERQLQSGYYSVYRTRQEVAMPAKTIIALNGTTVETIQYDTLKESSGKLCALANNGSKMYSVEQIYPDNDRQLLGNVQLTRGHVALTITVVNILNTARTTTYNLEIN